MTEQQNIVYMEAQILACQIEMQAMIAENKHCEQLERIIPYGEEAFMKLFERYPISHNDVISQLTSEY